MEDYTRKMKRGILFIVLGIAIIAFGISLSYKQTNTTEEGTGIDAATNTTPQ
jgi:hypothetical protein